MALVKGELSLHKATGQYCKRISGKVYYFGKDLRIALNRWNAEKDKLLAGEPIHGKPSLSELGNVFDFHHSAKVELGELSKRHFDQIQKTIGFIVDFFGASAKLEDLTPLDFERYRQWLYTPSESSTRDIEKRSLPTVAGDIRRTLIFVRWCERQDLVKKIKLGDFKAPSLKDLRAYRQSIPKKKIEPSDIKRLIDEANTNVKPIFLLMINAGIGAGDSAWLRKSDFEGMTAGKEFWLDIPRRKTSVERLVPLWKETRVAILEAIAKRAKHAEGVETDLAFLTSKGQPWVRETEDHHMDSASQAFRQTRNRLDIEKGTLYDLRRMFATIGLQTGDRDAVTALMGHTAGSGDMLAVYDQDGIAKDRLLKVVDHVRKVVMK